MAQDKQKGSPGFFSVLLGRGTSELKGETQAQDEKRPFNESRVAAPTSRPTGAPTSRQHEQQRSSLALDPRAPPRSSMARDTSRNNTTRDSVFSRPEQSGRWQRESLSSRPSVDARSSGQFVDALEVQHSKDRGESSERARAARKVAFNTPTHSLRKGKAGFPRMEEAGSSSDSSAQRPAPRPRPIPKSSKPKHVRSSSKADVEERNWNSSTATLQDKEESRTRSGKKGRSAKKANYPLTNASQSDGFQAVRVSGPDRVIIVPTLTSNSTFEAEHRQMDKQYMPVSSTAAQRRPGPTPNMPFPPPMSKRISQDISRSSTRPTDPPRSRSHRERPSNGRADSERMQSRPQRSPDKTGSRSSTSIRPMPPMPDMPTSTLLSQNMARARAGERNAISSYSGAPNGLHHATGTMPNQFHERPSNARPRAQRA